MKRRLIALTVARMRMRMKTTMVMAGRKRKKISEPMRQVPRGNDFRP